MDKRVVLVHTKGRHAGLWQILGTVEQLRVSLCVEDLPTFIPDVDFLDHKDAASLGSVKQRYVLYRELIEPAHSNKHFNPEQR